MNKKQRKNLIRIILSSILMIVIYLLNTEGILRFALYLIPYLIVGYDVLIKAFKGIYNRDPFDESLLMSVATIGTIILDLYEDGNYTEAIFVMLFYQVGEWFQSYAVSKSRKNIKELMDIQPEYANIEDESGNLKRVDPYEISVGSIIVVKPGEKIPLDGVVVSGNTSVNTSFLTGEAIPRDVAEGDEVISGCININNVIKVRTTKEFEDSTVAKILELIETASSKKSKSERFITKFARVYTPIVVYLALFLAVVPGLVLLILGKDPQFGSFIYRALTFLIISCPCALVISIPLSFFAGIGGASRLGILIKGSNYLETLSKVKVAIFDKTGTLTSGSYSVTEVKPVGVSKEELIHLAASLETFSNHPIALSIKSFDSIKESYESIEDVKEIPGLGISGKINGKEIYLGNDKLMTQLSINFERVEQVGTIIYVAMDRNYLGYIVISDLIKDESKQTIELLRKNGILETVMLTGDSYETAKSVSASLGIDKFYSNLLPTDKVSKLEEILEERKRGEMVAFIGDGINDAPVLSRADVGLSMGALGSDAAIEASDIVIMDDSPLKVVSAIRLARRCMSIVMQNIVFAIGIKVFFLILGAFGFTTMWMAIFADVGVTVIAILNSIRCLFGNK